MDVGHVVLFVALVISLICFYIDCKSRQGIMRAWQATNKVVEDKLEKDKKRLTEKLEDRESLIVTLKETEAVNLKELDAVVKFNKELKESLALSQLEFTRLAESSRRSVERVNGVLNPL
jgi:hypothetical protein